MVKKQQNRIIPSWVLKLIGITSLATTIVSLAVYWFKKYPPRRKINQNEEQQQPQEQSSAAAEDGWSNKFLNGIKSKVRKNKKKMTISLKNTVLWNPSPDLDTPIYGFKEHSIQLLTRLSYLYDIYVIIHVNSADEKQNIQDLIDNAATLMEHIDPRKIIFCSEEEGKIHIIRHIEPFIHIEGGWEKDDGEEIVKKLKPFVNKIVWLVTRRRRDSFKPEHIQEQDRQLLAHNIEISESFIETTIANEVK